MHSAHTQAFLAAAADMLESALKQARTEDPAGVEGLMLALRAGALITLKATLAPSTGLAQIAVEVVEPSGASHTLMAAELTKEVTKL